MYNYNEVIEKIQNTRRFGEVTGFEVTKSILTQLQNPEKNIPFVHVAGTNGKGSTTSFLCNILQQAGLKVGMFTSPHLVEFEERIRINGECIGKETVTRLGNQLLNEPYALSPTMFDYCVVMAVLYFKEQNCDIVVMETGIGGRYDSTNALGKPLVSVITKIGYDHMAILGNSLAEIAREKAGIIKANVPLVTQQQEQEVQIVLEDVFCEINRKEDFIQVQEQDIQYAKKIKLRTLGKFQFENAATAMLASKIVFKKLKDKGLIDFTKDSMEEMIQKGLEQSEWKGRMEILSENPFLLVDGAHNGHGVHALVDSLKSLYPNEKFHFIMAVMADKDYENMVEEILPLALDFTTVTMDYARALQAKTLASYIEGKGIKTRVMDSVQQVIEPFVEGKVIQGKTIAFGSLYFIGEIESLFG